MINTNIEYVNKIINYIQIGKEEEGIFSGLVIDGDQMIFINDNMRIISSEDKTHEYENLLNDVIEKLTQLKISFNDEENKYIIGDFKEFSNRYLKHLFNDEIIWFENTHNIEKEIEQKFAELDYYISILKKIDPVKHEEILPLLKLDK